MLSSDPDSAEDTATSARNDAEGEEQEEEEEAEEDSPAESDVLEEEGEVGVHTSPILRLIIMLKQETHEEAAAGNGPDQWFTFQKSLITAILDNPIMQHTWITPGCMFTAN